MKSRRDVPGLPLKALYTISELMLTTGFTRKRLRGLLRKVGVELFTVGRNQYVPLSEIRRCLQPLWAQITLAHRVSQGDLD